MHAKENNVNYFGPYTKWSFLMFHFLLKKIKIFLKNHKYLLVSILRCYFTK
jgi:hypothetical protein